MKIVVCIKQVVDPEMPYSAFKIDPAEKRVQQPQGTPPVISPFDENALEAALRIKDEHGANVIALSIGYKLARPVFMKTLAAGADELILVEDATLENIDSFTSADILAAVIKKLGDIDIVFTGRQSADWDSGITGCAISEELAVPCVTLARKVDIRGMLAGVERVLPDGFEVIEVPIPCVITVDSDLGELRPVTLQGLSAARKKPVQSWELSSINSVSLPGSRCQLIDIYMPERETVCEIIECKSTEDTAVYLANLLSEESLI